MHCIHIIIVTNIAVDNELISKHEICIYNLNNLSKLDQHLQKVLKKMKLPNLITILGLVLLLVLF